MSSPPEAPGPTPEEAAAILAAAILAEEEAAARGADPSPKDSSAWTRAARPGGTEGDHGVGEAATRPPARPPGA